MLKNIVEYWWEGDDFVFLADSGEEYRCANAYPVSVKFDGLDSTSTEEVEVEVEVGHWKEK